MADQCKYGIYARVGTREQADPMMEQKLEAVRMLQENGCKVAVAPVNYSGSKKYITPLPSIIDLSESDPAMETVRLALFGDHTLVINGMEEDDG